VKLPGPLQLVSTITDDGLPKPRPGGARRGQPVGQETPPTLRGGVEAPVNVPQVARGRGETPPGAGGGGAGGGAQQQRPQGPTVAWTVWRGPAEVAFARAEIEGDKRIVNATFKKPGEYTLRVVPNDTLESGEAKFIKVVVQ
jgi:hypothetical protein